VAHIGGKRTVVEFKTAAADFEEHEVELLDQLSAYQLAQPEAEQIGVCVLAKTKEPNAPASGAGNANSCRSAPGVDRRQRKHSSAFSSSLSQHRLALFSVLLSCGPVYQRGI
jgi:hypothetical protein